MPNFQKELSKKLKTMNLQNADVLLVSDPDLAEAIAKIPITWIGKKRKITLVVVKDISDIKALSQQEMKDAGWRKIRPCPYPCEISNANL